jgi:hypothetical protein
VAIKRVNNEHERFDGLHSQSKYISAGKIPAPVRNQTPAVNFVG